MSENRKDLPAPSAPNFNQRLRETIQTYLGKQGDPLDRGLTLRDLIANGIVKFKDGFNAVSLTGGGGGALPIAPVVVGNKPDLTPPPQPTGFAVSAAISHVFIEHDDPIYPQGHGHLRTHVYGAIVEAGDPLPTFDKAVEVGQFPGQVWAMPSNPATTWRLWTKWETVDGVLSATPAGGTNGLEAVTGQDVALLLAALQGQIKESQLFADLGARIDLVDGPSSLAGSVAARVLAEAQARGSAIQTEAVTRANADGNLASQITTLASTVNGNTAAIQAEAATRVTADAANAAAISQVQARLDTGDYAAVKVQSSTNASKVTGLEAKYTVKVDVNGYVSGFGLASTANNATPTSEFAVRADKFYIASPSGPGVAPSMPFIVRTTATTIGGVNVPAGVYMNDAFIQNGTITNAKIANLAVDNAKIANLSADKLTAGSIAVGQHIQSTGYAAGSAGWSINGNGTAEFGAASIRGQLTASQIDTRGLTIKDANGNVIFSSGTPLAASRVSGLGELATQSSVSTSQVYGLGLFATAPKLTSGNISSYIANAAIGIAQIADTIQSTNWSATSGWRINKAGTAFFNEVALRGSINGGDFTGYAWPAANNYGFHLGPNGLLLGNANNGKYVQITSTGDFYAPGFTIINGSGNFSGVVSASSLSAQSMNVALRDVLQSGSLVLPFMMVMGGFDGEYGYQPYPAGHTQIVPVNRLIATDVYDNSLISTFRHQPFTCKLYATGSGSYSGGNGQFDLAYFGEVVVSRRYSPGGVSSVNDNRVYISISHVTVRNDSQFGSFTLPTTVVWVLSRT